MKLELVLLASLVLGSMSPLRAQPLDGPVKAPAAPKKAEVDAAKAPAALSKIAIVGASVSSGMGLDPKSDPFSGAESKVRLANIIEASIHGVHEPLADESTLMFFTSPKGIAKKSLKDASDAKPTLLVALDFLFWLGYGAGDDGSRMDRLDAGLKLLEPFTCTVLLGDFADFNDAQVNPMMLAPQAIPSKEALAKLQARLAEWAKDRKNVVVVPVSSMFDKLRRNEEIDVRGNHFEAGSRAKLMQQDGLHTTLEGTCALWVIAVDAWLAAKPEGLDASAFECDVAKLAQKAPTIELGGKTDKADKAKKPVKAKGPKEKAGAGAGGG